MKQYLMWQNILDERDPRIISILNFIKREVKDKSSYDNGLLAGKAGLAIYWHYIYKFYNSEEYQDLTLAFLEQSLDSINTAKQSSPFCSGLSGKLFALCHLTEIGALQYNFDQDIAEDIDEFILEESLTHIKNGNYDYFHGGAGAILYFLERKQSTFTEKVEEILLALKQSATPFESGIAWPDPTYSKNGQIFNLSMSHGQSSLIALMALVIKKNPRSVAQELLPSAINWLLSTKKADGTSFYPSFWPKAANAPASRLAWCYGDLGIASALLLAAQITGNSQWYQEAISLSLHTSKRRDPASNSVMDCPLCHGAAGVAHVFNRLYQSTGIEDFKSASLYWYTYVLDFFEKNGHLCAWKNAKGSNEIFSWHQETAILDGYSGIGLSLISAISSQEPKWDRMLLLS